MTHAAATTRRPTLTIFACLFMAIGLAGCNAGLTNTNVAEVLPAPEFDNAYKLGGGDKISVNVFGESNITGTYQVDASGAISLPLVGRIEVGDRTPAMAEQELIARLKRGDIVQDPQVTVSVIEYRPFYVVGEVARPGAYSFFNGFTVLNALALAGGQTYRADLSKISIVRRTKAGETKVPTGSMAAIQPGDVVIVPERNF